MKRIFVVLLHMRVEKDDSNVDWKSYHKSIKILWYIPIPERKEFLFFYGARPCSFCGFIIPQVEYIHKTIQALMRMETWNEEEKWESLANLNRW